MTPPTKAVLLPTGESACPGPPWTQGNTGDTDKASQFKPNWALTEKSQGKCREKKGSWATEGLLPTCSSVTGTVGRAWIFSLSAGGGPVFSN